MAIDYGKKRVGIALTDPLKITAQPYKTISAHSREQLLSEVKKIAEEEDVEKIIVGLPLNMNGTESRSAHHARFFAEELGRSVPVPVDLHDERLSTVEAERILIETADLSRKKRKHKKDKLAAAILLRSYMEKNKT